MIKTKTLTLNYLWTIAAYRVVKATTEFRAGQVLTAQAVGALGKEWTVNIVAAQTATDMAAKYLAY